MQINIANLFPETDKGLERGPLPKQKTFMNHALETGGSKYIRYVGGIGSGKSLIGCITLLLWGIMYPGDYLIARQFMPELKDTTYKTFLEVCPPELIVEHRKADMIIRIKSNGGVATFMFRALEEPDKLRSLNLNGFYIDEANQVSEPAFVLLQGRLRGKHVRKGLITQNSGGHDWSWRWFVKKDMFSVAALKDLFVNIIAPSTENVHLPDGYVETMLGTWTEERIQREIYANEDSFEGQVYHEFRYDVHVVRPFAIPKDWTKVIGADHGFRNAACWLWGAVDGDDNVYIYREFYEKEWLIDEIVKGKKDKFGRRMRDKPGVLALTGDETIQTAEMDPSVDSERGKESNEWNDYEEALPDGFPLVKANRQKKAGIDRVKGYLKVNPQTKRPKLFIFTSCTNLADELSNYRYGELPISRQGKVSEKEEPLKVNDHACDALRYLIMTRPEAYEAPDTYYRKNEIDYHSIEGKLHRHLEAARNPTSSDEFDEYS